MEAQKLRTELPSNAHRELEPGEVYIPVMDPKNKYPEVTPWSVVMGLIMAVVFSAAAAYSGLKIGQVIEAAIPISIIAVGASGFLKKKQALGQNVIIQSIGASSGVIVAGAIFTIPALYILDLPVNFGQIFFSSLFGGFLGILFLIPLRRYFVKDMHGKYPFPEATATTEILITGEKGGNQAKLLVISGLIGGLYDFAFSAVKLFGESFTSKIIPIGKELAEKAKIEFHLNVSSMILGFGYLIGLKYATIIAVGSFMSWFVFIPLINSLGDIALQLGATTNPFASMSAGQIFVHYVRPIGIGAIAMAGIIGIVKSSGIILGAFSLAFKGLTGKKDGKTQEEIRTDKDIKMTFIMMFSILSIAAVFIFFVWGVGITVFQAFAALATVVVISFLFTTVAANAIAIVGSNPVSGMTLMTLILSSVILANVGLTGDEGMAAAIIIGGVVCTALSMAGGFITDLKVGYWLGSTPVKQQQWKFLGTIVSAATVGAVIFMLNDVYGFIPDEAHPDAMIAPQANAIAAVIESLMSPGAQTPWMLYAVGAIIALLLNAIGIAPLAFALGMYLPLELNTPLLVGGIIAYFVKKKTKDEKLFKARNESGTLIASGFLAGAAIFGVIGALLKYLEFDVELDIWKNDELGAETAALFAFIGLSIFYVWQIFRTKLDKKSELE